MSPPTTKSENGRSPLLDIEAGEMESDTTHQSTTLPLTSLPKSVPFKYRREKVVGLKDAHSLSSARFRRQEFLEKQKQQQQNRSTNTLAGGGSTPFATTIEDKETLARQGEIKNPLVLLLLSNIAAFKVMIYYLMTAETCLTCGLTAGMIIYWYNYGLEHDSDIRAWTGSGMDFVILAFAVISPIATAIGMAFTRREGALMMISEFRSSAHHLYLAHALWDWSEGGGRAGCKDFDFLDHCDAVLAQLVGIGDELSRFLTLPTTSRSRHRMTNQGRREAAITIDVAYRLMESMLTQRMTRISIYGERIKSVGLSSSEISRVRQYERFIHTSIERLRMYKMYRTPQALRSFARIFTFLLPPFYAPKFAQVAIDVHSLGVGLSFGLITAIVLSALFESLQVIEDPFVGFLALDGIDVREEFEVLLWTSLAKTRRVIFPDAKAYPTGRRASLCVPNLGGARPRRKPSVILHMEASPPSSPRPRGPTHTAASSHFGGDASSGHHDRSVLLGGVENTDPVNAPQLEPTALFPDEDDEEAAEFGYPLLEDPESEKLLRQSNFQPDGVFVHHLRRTSTATPTSHMMGLAFRGRASSSQSDPSRP